jgi:hypothetical protein
MRTYKVLLTVALKSMATEEELAAYIEDAVTSWGGSLRPPGGYGDDDTGDPMFGNVDAVHVKTVTRVRRPQPTTADRVALKD